MGRIGLSTMELYGGVNFLKNNEEIIKYQSNLYISFYSFVANFNFLSRLASIFLPAY